MGILDWINTYSGALTFLATLILIIVTAIYVYYTQRIMKSTKEQFILQQNPVIGIKIGEMTLVKLDDNYREFDVNSTLINLGNAPALEVIVDSEIKSNVCKIKGENIFPSRWISVISYIRVGEELYSDPIQSDITFVQSFNSDIFDLMVEGFEKESNLNNERMIKELEPEYNSNVLSIDVYYKNSFNHYFKSHFETHLIQGEKFPKYIEVKPFFDPNPIFYSKPITEKVYTKEVELRKLKRERLEILTKD